MFMFYEISFGTKIQLIAIKIKKHSNTWEVSEYIETKFWQLNKYKKIYRDDPKVMYPKILNGTPRWYDVHFNGLEKQTFLHTLVVYTKTRFRIKPISTTFYGHPFSSNKK